MVTSIRRTARISGNFNGVIEMQMRLGFSGKTLKLKVSLIEGIDCLNADELVGKDESRLVHIGWWRYEKMEDREANVEKTIEEFKRYYNTDKVEVIE